MLPVALHQSEEMIQVLFTIVFAEMVLILSLLFRSPLRQLVIMGLDCSKQGRGPLVAKSVGGTILVFFSSTIYSVFNVHKKRSTEAGFINPTNEVLMAHRILEASLTGNHHHSSTNYIQIITCISCKFFLFAHKHLIFYVSNKLEIISFAPENPRAQIS